MRSGGRSVAQVTLLAMLVTACAHGPAASRPATSSAPSGSPVADTSVSAASTATSSVPSATSLSVESVTPTPPATPPADLARVVVAERDDIEVRIELQRNPLPAGERSWARVTVTNRGTDEVTWAHDGCAAQAWIRGSSAVPWVIGVEHDGQAAKFKARALDRDLPDASDFRASILFVPKNLLGSPRPTCADIGLAASIKPGKSIKQTVWWSGFTTKNRALPPTGPMPLTIFAGYYFRGEEPSDLIQDGAINLGLDAWVVDAPRRPSPAEAIDAALADPTFAAFVETQDLANGRDVLAWYDAQRDVWEVGVLPWHETTPPRIHGVLVDGTSGVVIGPFDRVWDHDKDHFP